MSSTGWGLTQRGHRLINQSHLHRPPTQHKTEEGVVVATSGAAIDAHGNRGDEEFQQARMQLAWGPSDMVGSSQPASTCEAKEPTARNEQDVDQAPLCMSKEDVHSALESKETAFDFNIPDGGSSDTSQIASLLLSNRALRKRIDTLKSHMVSLAHQYDRRLHAISRNPNRALLLARQFEDSRGLDGGTGSFGVLVDRQIDNQVQPTAAPIIHTAKPTDTPADRPTRWDQQGWGVRGSVQEGASAENLTHLTERLVAVAGVLSKSQAPPGSHSHTSHLRELTACVRQLHEETHRFQLAAAQYRLGADREARAVKFQEQAELNASQTVAKMRTQVATYRETQAQLRDTIANLKQSAEHMQAKHGETLNEQAARHLTDCESVSTNHQAHTARLVEMNAAQAKRIAALEEKLQELQSQDESDGEATPTKADGASSTAVTTSGARDLDSHSLLMVTLKRRSHSHHRAVNSAHQQMRQVSDVFAHYVQELSALYGYTARLSTILDRVMTGKYRMQISRHAFALDIPQAHLRWLREGSPTTTTSTTNNHSKATSVVTRDSNATSSSSSAASTSEVAVMDPLRWVRRRGREPEFAAQRLGEVRRRCRLLENQFGSLLHAGKGAQGKQLLNKSNNSVKMLAAPDEKAGVVTDTDSQRLSQNLDLNDIPAELVEQIRREVSEELQLKAVKQQQALQDTQELLMRDLASTSTVQYIKQLEEECARLRNHASKQTRSLASSQLALRHCHSTIESLAQYKMDARRRQQVQQLRSRQASALSVHRARARSMHGRHGSCTSCVPTDAPVTATAGRPSSASHAQPHRRRPSSAVGTSRGRGSASERAQTVRPGTAGSRRNGRPSTAGGPSGQKAGALGAPAWLGNTWTGPRRLHVSRSAARL